MANSSFHDSSSSSNGSCGNKSPSRTRVNKNICIPPHEVTTDHKSLLFQVQLPSAPRNMEVALDCKIKLRMTPMKKISSSKGSQTNPSPPYIIDSDTQSEDMQCPANSPSRQIDNPLDYLVNNLTMSQVMPDRRQICLKEVND